ncbi:hypothetical protein V7S43_018072 [Phytophthora oleae]|uniref:Uncharacterized protein n=1 Tax=Phytophthora oleae TaxID=2107226 RepID=A0ABD3EV94_9STRA
MDERCILGIDDLNFSHDEVFEYVTKWFKGISSFEGASASMEEFCANLEGLTGGHVGLCATAVDALNEVVASRNRGAIGLPSPTEWIRMVQSGSLYQADDNALFEKLTSTRAVKVLQSVDSSELDRLERITYGGNTDYETAVVKEYLRTGILVRSEGWFKFSSPVMWRLFAKKRLSGIVRAVDASITLPDMIARVMHSIDYGSTREWVLRNVWGEVPLERAWQMEFYKAVYRCTPSTFKTSVDDDVLFGSSEFIDLTVRQDEIVWVIELLLREGSNLAAHVERFSPGGRHSSLPLSDFCLIDFRRVASIDDVPVERIAEDTRDCDKLFVVHYDAGMAGVVVVNSAMDAHRISSSKSSEVSPLT